MPRSTAKLGTPRSATPLGRKQCATQGSVAPSVTARGPASSVVGESEERRYGTRQACRSLATDRSVQWGERKRDDASPHALIDSDSPTTAARAQFWRADAFG